MSSRHIWPDLSDPSCLFASYYPQGKHILTFCYQEALQHLAHLSRLCAHCTAFTTRTSRASPHVVLGQLHSVSFPGCSLRLCSYLFTHVTPLPRLSDDSDYKPSHHVASKAGGICASLPLCPHLLLLACVTLLGEAVTKLRKLGGFKQEKFILSWFLGLEVPNQGLDWATVPLQLEGEGSFCASF